MTVQPLCRAKGIMDHGTTPPSEALQPLPNKRRLATTKPRQIQAKMLARIEPVAKQSQAKAELPRRGVKQNPAVDFSTPGRGHTQTQLHSGTPRLEWITR
jgi:hypothetical protein